MKKKLLIILFSLGYFTATANAIQVQNEQHQTSEQIQYIEQSPEVDKGREALSRDDYQSAINLFNQALKTNPDDKAALLGLALAYLLNENYKESENILTQYENKYGKDNDFLTEKARFFALTNQPEKALPIVEYLLKTNPTSDTLLDIKQYALSHPSTKDNVKTDMTDIKSNGLKTESIINQDSELLVAERAVSAKNYKKAEIIYRKYLSRNPKNKSVFISLIKVTLWQENYSSAQKLLTRYKNLFGQDDEYLTEQARYYSLNNRPSQALAILKPLLKKDPTNETLLDIKQYALTHPEIPSGSKDSEISGAKSASQLAELAELTHSNADLYAKAAQAYFGEDYLRQAMIMIDKALALSPNRYDYLLLKGKIAYALDDKIVAYCTYRLLYLINCNDPEVILGFARAAERMNKLDEAAMLFWRYISMRPFERKPWIEYAYVQSWRGNDRLAIWALNRYERLFGISQEYLVARARNVASADRPTEALSIICPLLPIIPNNYDLNYANTLALYYNNQPIEMIESLKKVNQLEPNTEETTSLNEFVLTPYRSNINLKGYHSNDTDSIHINELMLSGQYFISPVTSLLANVSTERLTASIGSGLEPINGAHGLWLKRLNVGMNHRINPMLALQGLIGGASATEGGGNLLIYQGDAFITPSETFDVNLQIKRDFYDESARTVSLGINRILNQAQFFWQPCIQCYVFGNAFYAFFSDDNKETYEEINPSIQIIGSDKLNLSVGVDGTWYQFSKRKDNGYYDPLHYRYYGFIANAIFKKNENVEFELSVGFGTQKDETFNAYSPANDYSARGYFGIYQDWYVVLSADLSTRGRPIAENVSANSTYRVYAFDAMITRRF